MRDRYALFAIFIGTVISTTTAQAQTTYVWSDSNSSWTTPADWTPNGPADWFTSQTLSGALASFPSKAVIINQPDVDNSIQVRGITINDTQAAWNISSSLGVLSIGNSGLNVIALENVIDADDFGLIVLNGAQKNTITLHNIPCSANATTCTPNRD